MLKKSIIILFVLMQLMQLVEARAPEFSKMKLISNFDLQSTPHSICYKEQGGTALAVLPPVGYGDRGVSAANKTHTATVICMNLHNERPPSLECIAEQERRILALQPGQTACDYANNPQECYSCASTVQSQQMTRELINFVLIIGSLIILPLSLLYFILIGIFCLIKRRLLGPKWLLITALILFTLSVLVMLFLPRLHIFAQY